jgi:hypothetical protein
MIGLLPFFVFEGRLPVLAEVYEERMFQDRAYRLNSSRLAARHGWSPTQQGLP